TCGLVIAGKLTLGMTWCPCGQTRTDILPPHFDATVAVCDAGATIATAHASIPHPPRSMNRLMVPPISVRCVLGLGDRGAGRHGLLGRVRRLVAECLAEW